MDYALPRLRTKFGERAFSHAGPSTWNELPDNVCTVFDPVKFENCQMLIILELLLVFAELFLLLWCVLLVFLACICISFIVGLL